MNDRIGFARRYRTDKRFQEGTEDFVREATLVNLGIDPDRLAQSWDGKKFTLTPLMLMAEKLGLVEPGASPEMTEVVVKVDFGDFPEKSPVADMDAKAAEAHITGANGAELMVILLTDTRTGIAMKAARALFDLRNAKTEE